MIVPPFSTLLTERMKTHGKYPGGGPKGAVIHFTAGHDGAENTIKDGLAKGFAYWCIQRDGRLFCAHSADEWGWHCGQSAWSKGIGKLVGTCNDDLIGIEMNAAGRLTKGKDGVFRSWFGTVIPATEVRHCDGLSPDQCEGYYHAYTAEQEVTLVQTLLWLGHQFPRTFLFSDVLGHSEVSGKLGIGYFRKNDPSAALSMTMPAFRSMLLRKFAASLG